MKVRIIQQPRGTLEGLRLQFYREGEVYDLPSEVATALVAEGYAVIEMRCRNQRPLPYADRRQTATT